MDVAGRSALGALLQRHVGVTSFRGLLGEVDELVVAVLARVRVERSVGQLAEHACGGESRSGQRTLDARPRVVALGVARGHPLVEAGLGLVEGLDDQLGEACRRLGVAAASAPGEEHPGAVLRHVARERGPVGRQRVDVEHEHPAWSEVGREAAEGGVQVALLHQVVEGVVQAGDQVEAAHPAQRPDVGHEQIRLGRLAAREGHHLRRYVACGDGVTAPQEGQEALARPACGVEQSRASEPRSRAAVSSRWRVHPS